MNVFSTKMQVGYPRENRIFWVALETSSKYGRLALRTR